MRELKGIGATNADANRQRGLTGPARLRAMLRGYEAFRRDDGRYPATWEVVYASAWAPDEGQPIRTEHGEEASVSISSLKVRRR
jgi:malonyl-CoA O-methyltransferase